MLMLMCVSGFFVYLRVVVIGDYSGQLRNAASKTDPGEQLPRLRKWDGGSAAQTAAAAPSCCCALQLHQRRLTAAASALLTSPKTSGTRNAARRPGNEAGRFPESC